MKIKDSGEPLSEEQVKAFEAKIGYPLPEDYRAFLLQHNGGEPEYPNFQFHLLLDGETLLGEDHIQDFFGLDLLQWEYDTLFRRIPKNLLAIASDWSGSVVCISLYGEDKGKIYLWDVEIEEEILEGEEPTYYNVWWAADSFTEFLNGLWDD